MYIVTQDGKSMVNLSQVNSVFINNQNRVCATFSNSTGCQLGEYEYPLGLGAIKMLANAAKNEAEVFFMPTKEAVRAAVEAIDSHGHTERHAANGAVIRRNGGS